MSVLGVILAIYTTVFHLECIGPHSSLITLRDITPVLYFCLSFNTTGAEAAKGSLGA